MSRLLLGIAVGSSLLAPRLADACSHPECVGGGALIYGDVVPANAPGLMLTPAEIFSSMPSLDLSAYAWVSGSSTVTLSGWALHPNARAVFGATSGTFVPGETYRLVEPNVCASQPMGTPTPRTTFTATSAAPLPDLSGVPTLSLETQEVAVVNLPTGATCSTWTRRPVQPLSVQPPADWAPWGSVTVRDIYIDGTLWDPQEHDWRPPLSHWRNPFVACPEDQTVVEQGLQPGSHTVRVRLTLPGHGFIETADQSFTLDCSLLAMSDAGVPDGAWTDTGSPDGGAPDGGSDLGLTDAGSADLGSSDLGTVDAGVGSTADAGSFLRTPGGGEGCRTSGGSVGSFWLLLLGTAVFARRRRFASDFSG